MPAQTKKVITPTGLISSILVLAGFGSLLFGVSDHFVTKAEAADIVAQQQQDRVETDLQLVDLEIKWVEDKLETKPDDKEAQKRLEYLKERRAILEKYQLELKSK